MNRYNNWAIVLSSILWMSGCVDIHTPGAREAALRLSSRNNMKQIVLATRNSDKITEIEKLMQLDHAELVGIHKYPQAPDVIEDGDSLRANALKKARSAFQATGLPSIADDSGLEVDFLEGAPGVFSSRFAGENATYSDNNVKLIRLYGLFVISD